MNKNILLAAITSVTNVILVKQYIITKNIYYVLILLLSGLITLYSYYNIFTTIGISSGYPIVKLLSILIIVLCGVIIYDEQINYKKFMGIILSIIAMYLLLCK